MNRGVTASPPQHPERPGRSPSLPRRIPLQAIHPVRPPARLDGRLGESRYLFPAERKRPYPPAFLCPLHLPARGNPLPLLYHIYRSLSSAFFRAFGVQFCTRFPSPSQKPLSTHHEKRPLRNSDDIVSWAAVSAAAVQMFGPRLLLVQQPVERQELATLAGVDFPPSEGGAYWP